MIFVDIPLEVWVITHPGLEVIEGECDNCGAYMVTNRPFIAKGYVGIRATDCPCGKNKHTLMSLVTVDFETHKKWEREDENDR